MQNSILSAYLSCLLLMPAQAGEQERRLECPVQPGAHFQVHAGSGGLSILGREGQSTIVVMARVSVPGTENIDFGEIELSLDPSPSGARLVAQFKKKGAFLRWLKSIGSTPRIDLEITVPAQVNCSIKDGSGSMVVQNLRGNVEIEDGSGSIEVRGIQGNLIIQDGSGPIEVDEVSGSVSIHDGSGEVKVAKIGGDLKIHDGSGGLEINTVAGDVHLEDVGSGAVVTKNIKGRVTQSKP